MKHFLPSSVMLTPFLVKNYDAFVGENSAQETDQEIVSSEKTIDETIDTEKTKS
ncbi:hypothetical protein [Vibrio fortis]|uniref:hypothetical protein n=1 Tax=Vibrio fortis TaxID=212667 RepID=UPI0038CD9C99